MSQKPPANREEQLAISHARAYTAPGVSVFYDGGRCLHFAECVRGLPEVFDARKRPWIQPENAPPEEVAEVVRRCPSGALHYRLEAESAEPHQRLGADSSAMADTVTKFLIDASPNGDVRWI